MPSPEEIPSVSLDKFPSEECKKCGARRPKVEIQHKACANCQDMEARNAAFKTEEELKAEQEAAQAKTEATLKNLPDLDNVASSLYDNERGVWWLGVNLKEQTANEVSLPALMDQAKPALLNALMDWRAREKRKSRILVRATASVESALQSAKDKAALLKSKVAGLLRP